jgi:hypothetical protein
MDEIISYKMCAVKVRNAKLRNYLKIRSGFRNFYRLSRTSLTSTNAFTISCLSIEPPAPPPPHPGKLGSAALVQTFAKSLLHHSSTIRTICRLFADYLRYSSTIRGLFVDYSRTIRRLFASLL